MPPAPVSWRAVAEPPDLANVAGPRVRFLCLDVTDAHVVLGANTGSVYVFARTRATGEDAASPFGPDADPPEGPMRFLTMVSPADAPPIDPPDGAPPARRNITPAISRLRLNPDGTLCAVANAAGVLQVLEFALDSERRARPGRVVAQIPNAHYGREVTWLEWSSDGCRLLSGDDVGTVAVTDISGYRADADVASRDQNETPRPMTVAQLLTTAALTSILRVGSRVVQASFSPDGTMAIISTVEAVTVLSVKTGARPRVGSKPREGLFGGCFHAAARLCDGASTFAAAEEKDADDEKDASWMLAARPGRRLWAVEARVDSDDVPLSRVLATLRPDVPAPSRAPGAPAPAPGAKPRRWEFGEMHSMGLCALSVSERAVAVVEVPGASLLAWFPLNEPGSVGAAAGVASAATRGSRAFLLAPQERGGGVWCLEAPPTREALVCAVADAARDVAEMTHALGLAERLRVAETRLLEDARRAAEVVVAETESSGEPSDEDSNAKALAAAFASYEVFYRRATTEASPPPPRPARTAKDASDGDGDFASDATKPPRPPDAVAEDAKARARHTITTATTATATVTSAVDATVAQAHEPPAPSHSRSSSTSSAARLASGAGDALAAAGEYTSVEAPSRFFFYNPHKGDGKSRSAARDAGKMRGASRDPSPAPSHGSGGEADVASASVKSPERRGARDGGDTSRKKKKTRAKVVDDLDRDESAAKTGRGLSTERGVVFATETSSFAGSDSRKLDEDRADAAAAAKALAAALDALRSVDGSPPFSRRSAYVEWRADDGDDATRASAAPSSNLAASAVFGSGSFGDRSVEGRRREATRRARERRVDAAVAAARALLLARRGMDAGPLIPELVRWRDARAVDENLADEDEDEDEDEFARGADAGFETRADTTNDAAKAAGAALEGVETRLEAARRELFGDEDEKDEKDEKDGDEKDAPRRLGDAAARALEEEDARERAELDDSSASASVSASDVSACTFDFTSEAETRASAFRFLRGMGADPSRSERDAREAERRRTETARALAPEAAEALATETIRLALVEIAEAAEVENDVASASAPGASASAANSLDAVVAAFAAAPAVGAATVLRCLETACEDESIAALMTCEAVETPAGEAISDAVASAALHLVARRREDIRRESAAADALAPLAAHLAKPPPAPIGRFPQLRATVEAESARGEAREEAMRALPFARRSEKSRGWTLATARRAPAKPRVEERGDWGIRVALSTVTCARCELPLREAHWGWGAEARDGRDGLVTYPCGHTYHECCATEEACGKCASAARGALASPAPGGKRASVAVNAELRALFEGR